MKTDNRRNFLKQATALTALSLAAPVLTAAEKPSKLRIPSGSVILFQGDSITDGGRSRNNDWNHVMGHGYAYLVASRLGFDLPEKQYHFYNRGISGNTVPDLAERWQKDTLDIKPDLLSILIGVNDVNAEINGRAGFSSREYAESYRKLLDQTRQKLPDLKLVIGEPFLLPVGRVKSKWEEWSEKVRHRQETARELAKEFAAAFIPYQSAFNDALKRASAEYWIWDGIHPMPAGHELMSREWIKAVKELYR